MPDDFWAAPPVLELEDEEGAERERARWAEGALDWRLVVNLVRAPDGRYRRRTRLTGGTRENAEAALQRWIRELSALCAARGTGS
jgi:hypothetical protein